MLTSCLFKPVSGSYPTLRSRCISNRDWEKQSAIIECVKWSAFQVVLQLLWVDHSRHQFHTISTDRFFFLPTNNSLIRLQGIRKKKFLIISEALYLDIGTEG